MGLTACVSLAQSPHTLSTPAPPPAAARPYVPGTMIGIPTATLSRPPRSGVVSSRQMHVAPRPHPVITIWYMVWHSIITASERATAQRQSLCGVDRTRHQQCTRGTAYAFRAVDRSEGTLRRQAAFQLPSEYTVRPLPPSPDNHMHIAKSMPHASHLAPESGRPLSTPIPARPSASSTYLRPLAMHLQRP